MNKPTKKPQKLIIKKQQQQQPTTHQHYSPPHKTTNKQTNKNPTTWPLSKKTQTPTHNKQWDKEEKNERIPLMKWLTHFLVSAGG